MGVQSWWGNLLQGGVSAIIGGMVAALTAWAVVTVTRRNERRSALEIEARRAAIDFFFVLSGVAGHLENALADWLMEGRHRALSGTADP